MNKDAFLKTAIEVLKYDMSFKTIDKRENLIRLLARSEVNFLPQWGFVGAGVSDQRWEIIELRCPVPLLNEAYELKNSIDRIIEYVYEESAEHALQKVDIRPLVIDTPPEVIEHDVVFDELQDTVIQGIRDAKYMIWAAIAWFSNAAIYNELIAAKNRGVSIRVIVSNEPTNADTVHKLQQDGIDVNVIDKWGKDGRNRVHHKFCIVDLDYVMHGSYNWSANANNNVETLATALDREFVLKFADEFMELYNGTF
ncbi:MAG: phospholipase D-like domain-containing protein [Acetivibrio ethanolgignens]